MNNNTEEQPVNHDETSTAINEVDQLSVGNISIVDEPVAMDDVANSSIDIDTVLANLIEQRHQLTQRYSHLILDSNHDFTNGDVDQLDQATDQLMGRINRLNQHIDTLRASITPVPTQDIAESSRRAASHQPMETAGLHISTADLPKFQLKEKRFKNLVISTFYFYFNFAMERNPNSR
jgi:hypothetical protein